MNDLKKDKVKIGNAEGLAILEEKYIFVGSGMDGIYVYDIT